MNKLFQTGHGRCKFLGDVAEYLGAGAKVAEVGVLHGAFSRHVLKHMQPSLFIMVDAWQSFPKEDYVDRQNTRTQALWDSVYKKVCDRFSFYPECQIRRGLSLDVAAAIPEGSLDFVYLDANHCYESVLEDLKAWTKTVRRGGIMSGHDYCVMPDAQFPGVKQAVDQFCTEMGYPLHFTKETDYKSFYFLKD